MEAAKVSDTPLEFVAEYLTKAKEIAEADPNVPEELTNYLQKALSIASGLDSYLEDVTDQESEHLSALYRKTMDHDWNKIYEDGKTRFKLSKQCITGHVEGQVLKTFVRMVKARSVLEIGMFTGYGALAMAEGLPEDGKLIACEIEPYLKEFTQPIFDKSPHGKKITMQIGPAMESLKELAATGEQFDFVFIDADKVNYTNYYNCILDNNLLRADGVICVDNSLFKGQVFLENVTDENGLALRKFNLAVQNDPRVEQVILPVRDGISIIRRVSNATAEKEQKNGVVRDEVFSGLHGKSILDRLRLDGKAAYVTGGGQGIGRALAHALGEAGAKVAIVDAVLEKAESVAYELKLKGIQSISIAADISKSEDVQRMIDMIVSKWGTIHIACNNAGINANSASENTTLKEWDQTFNINLRGTFMCCQAAGRIMLKQGYGKIINTASMASLIVPHPQKQLAYNTSKAGVVKLTQTLGTEWIDRGVRVNCLSPGIVDTPLIHSEALKPLVQRWLTDIPAGRLAQVTDLQAAVVYLASEASDYMTGHNLVIEGGQSLW
ncbi:uncharacterized protein LOC117413974 isoform X1 [Acipenser ruthenus]|uniref:uncharacterized protein LOC117413974 isoform X1 n=1 Tax=Acipenser ruthenus TaxID=7906 RepID=UPI0027413627|nr:uncharacterized protein LOC117413974 isoform X1 [Acipenser ruthenus]